MAQRYKPGDVVYLKTDEDFYYPMAVEDFCSPFVDVVFISKNAKTKEATLQKTRLHMKVLTSKEGEVKSGYAIEV